MPEYTTIKTMFNSIYKKYDVLNNILSLGTHWIWKKKLRNEVLSFSPESVLDVASGTGDIALLIHKEAKHVKIKGVDISDNMLSIAREKMPDIPFEVDDITQSKEADNSFDVSCISFGIRNVSDVNKAMSEMARISKKAILVLEFGQPRNIILKSCYFGAMKFLIPFLGSLMSKKSSYKYLIESSANFPSDEQFLKIASEGINFKSSSSTPLFGGVCYLYKFTI